MRILTLTLHPAIDRVLQIRRLDPGATFDARTMLIVPAGKGVNTARSLSCVARAPLERRHPAGKIPAPPIVAAAWIGAAERAWFAERLAALSNVRAALCPRACPTRGAYTLLEDSGRETHIKEAMPSVTLTEERALLSFWEKTVRRGDIVALCGSAPPGTSPRTIQRLFAIARRRRARAIIADTNGVALDIAGAASLDGLKGNAAEIGAWLKLGAALDLSRRAHRRALLAAFARKAAPRAILVTLGAQGAALATPDRLLRAAAPRATAYSTCATGGLSTSAIPGRTRHDSRAATGCGDAATAGWIWALQDNFLPEECLRRAVACGTAKLHSPDPGFLDPALARRLLAATQVESLPAS